MRMTITRERAMVTMFNIFATLLPPKPPINLPWPLSSGWGSFG